ncbi:MAG: hypothetical protein QXP04_05485, partial [Candidatus Nanoarchaeia archaeon]|nr:hypothetical protein [Candidatus Jingweiarchaeum tengchongense]
MKTSTIIIAIIGIAIIGYVIYKYIYLPKTSLNTTITNSTTPSAISSSSTSSSSTIPYHLTSVTQNYYTPPSNELQLVSKTSQIAFAQKIANQRFPQLNVKKSPNLSSSNSPVTTYSPTQSFSTVHKSNPTTISTGIGKYIRPMGGMANPNGESKTVNRNSYSYIQE